MLAAELGRDGVYGKGMYAWYFSDDLWHPMAVIEDVGGEWRPVLDYVADEETGLLLARQRFALRPECPTLDKQWVLCKWQPPVDPYTWRMSFGHSLEWPGPNDYAPINAAGSGHYASLDPGEEPTKEITRTAIQTIRANRAVTLADEKTAGEKALEARESKAKEQILDELRDIGFVAGRPVQLSKGDKDYSFGGFEATTGETNVN